MLEIMRKMSPDAKKKVVVFSSGVLTFIILALWGMHSFGVFSVAFDSTQKQGVAVFSFLDENVQKAYTAFQNDAPKITASSTASTTPNEIHENEFLTGQAATTTATSTEQK